MDNLLKYDKWVYYYNINNYKDIPNPVRETFKRLLYNRNPILFDKKNTRHLRWDDTIREQIEIELSNRDELQYENDTYLFAKHLMFVDVTGNKLHNKIYEEIYNNKVEDKCYISDDDDFDVEP
jgi:hypothetical protein